MTSAQVSVRNASSPGPRHLSTRSQGNDLGAECASPRLREECRNRQTMSRRCCARICARDAAGQAETGETLRLAVILILRPELAPLLVQSHGQRDRVKAAPAAPLARRQRRPLSSPPVRVFAVPCLPARSASAGITRASAAKDPGAGQKRRGELDRQAGRYPRSFIHTKTWAGSRAWSATVARSSRTERRSTVSFRRAAKAATIWSAS